MKDGDFHHLGGNVTMLNSIAGIYGGGVYMSRGKYHLAGAMPRCGGASSGNGPLEVPPFKLDDGNVVGSIGVKYSEPPNDYYFLFFLFFWGVSDWIENCLTFCKSMKTSSRECIAPST